MGPIRCPETSVKQITTRRRVIPQKTEDFTLLDYYIETGKDHEDLAVESLMMVIMMEYKKVFVLVEKMQFLVLLLLYSQHKERETFQPVSCWRAETSLCGTTSFSGPTVHPVDDR
jgi:hypothetical protein